MANKDVFTELFGINVNEHTEKKNVGGANLTYLSWAWAWAEVAKKYPDANYEIKLFPDVHGINKPFIYDEATGYMVFTSVTIGGVTRVMWLPVMDGANRAMYNHSYTVVNKYGKENKVEAATMTDINKAIMRCLTKNLGMFGLGLYIYAGEDIPETIDEPAEAPAAPAKAPAAPVKATSTPIAEKAAETKQAPAEAIELTDDYWKFCDEAWALHDFCDKNGVDWKRIWKKYGLNKESDKTIFRKILFNAIQNKEKAEAKKRAEAGGNA